MISKLDLKCRLCRAVCSVVNKIMFWRRGYRMSFTICPKVQFWWNYDPGVFDDDPRGKLVKLFGGGESHG